MYICPAKNCTYEMKKMFITLLFLCAAYAILPVHTLQAQDAKDSIAFLSARWNWKKLDKGAEAGSARMQLFGSTQTISIIKYPARKFRTQIIHSPGECAGTTDSLAMKHGASIAVNGSYFNMKTLFPHTFLSYKHRIVGRTEGDEIVRSDGILAFKGKKGRTMYIFPCDSSSYEDYREKYYCAIASGPLLIQDGKTQAFQDNKFNSTRHPRSIIGYDSHGYCYFIVIDGRFPGMGDGATIPEAAAVARYLGLESAINMDGGGSSTLWSENTGVINHPSDNGKFDHRGCRTVANIVIAK